MISEFITQHLSQFSRIKTKTHGEPPRPRTVTAHRLQLGRFGFEYDRQFADLSGLTVNYCKDWILGLAELTSQANVNQALSALAGFLSYLVDGGIWTQDQLESWQRFHAQQYCRIRPISSASRHLTLEKMELLFSALASTPNARQAERDVAFFGCILFGFARPAELCLIRYGDVKYRQEVENRPESYTLELPPEITKDHSSRTAEIFHGSSIGKVDIFDCLHAYFLWRAANGAQGPTEPFFIGVRQNEQDITSRRLWNKVFKRAVLFADPDGTKGLKHVTPYWLRHTCGEALPGRLPPRDIQQLFGHSAACTTQAYTNHQNEDRMAAARLKAHLAILQSIRP